MSNPICIVALKGIEGMVGGRIKLAEKLGITRVAITGWVNRKTIPGKYIKQLSLISGGRFTVEDLLAYDEYYLDETGN